LGIILPTDFHIFHRSRYTTNQQFDKPQVGMVFEIGFTPLQLIQ
jgi:hypothetical protein